MIDCSPLIINFANGPYRLTGAASPVMFDIRANGQPVPIGWTAPGADEAFLGLDLDRDGKIGSGEELFGNATRLRGGVRARNGFAALAQYDTNRDAVIDEQDDVWSRLLLWRDLDHDGVSDAAELSSVASSGVTAIGLDHHWTGRSDPAGNVFRFESRVWIADATRRATPRPLYDIFLVMTGR